MGCATRIPSIALLLASMFFYVSGSSGETLIITNKCSYTVWPVISSADGNTTTGFVIQQGESITVAIPSAWSGSLWGRTLCSHDATGKFRCVTGDCGSPTIECSDGGKAAAPVTLVELAMNGTGGMDLYDVSLVNGFNIPLMVEPWDLNCRARGCVKDLNVACPKELKVMRNGEGVACKKVCQSEPCLSSHFFKTQCPFAHVDAYDHASFNCASAHYIITFCPASSPSWPKPESKRYPAAAPPAVVNSGGDHRSLIKVIVAAVLALTSASGFYLVCKLTIHFHLCTNTANQVQPQAETTLEIEIQPDS